MIRGEHSADDDMKAVNSNYPEIGYDKNCASTVLAYELRRRGYDVKALKFDSDYDGATYSEIESMFINGKFTTFGEVENFYEIGEKLKEQGNGSRGHLGLQFYDCGGHSVVYEVENDQLIIRDTQLGIKMNEKEAFEMFEYNNFNKDDTSFMQMNNLEVNWNNVSLEIEEND